MAFQSYGGQAGGGGAFNCMPQPRVLIVSGDSHGRVVPVQSDDALGPSSMLESTTKTLI